MTVELTRIDADNVDKLGFFCKKSKRKTEGWQAKRGWLDRASVEMWMAVDGKRQVGFVEFARAEDTWRAVIAPGHLVIHCIWVVGRAKQVGTGSALLGKVVEAADRQDLGVAALTSTKAGWLQGSKLVARNGFVQVDRAPPSFELWAKTPKGQPTPSLPNDWDARAAAFGDGLTLVTTYQCPYVDTMREVYSKTAEAHGLAYREVHLASAEEVRTRSPSAFGVFSVVVDGKLLTWRYESTKVLGKLLAS